MDGWLDKESTMKSRSITKSPPVAKLPLVNGAGRPLLTLDQIIKKWAGVFEPEFWDEVRKARKPVIKPITSKERE
jgi:hypothetical protein